MLLTEPSILPQYMLSAPLNKLPPGIQQRESNLALPPDSTVAAGSLLNFLGFRVFICHTDGTPAPFQPLRKT